MIHKEEGRSAIRLSVLLRSSSLFGSSQPIGARDKRVSIFVPRLQFARCAYEWEDRTKLTARRMTWFFTVTIFTSDGV
jgi:hypothetical protein